jgi:hypothetical protein
MRKVKYCTAISRLRGGYLVAIKDNHANSTARKFTEALVGSGAVNILFIEYSSDAKVHGAGAVAAGNEFGVSLNAAISNMLDNGLTGDQASIALRNGGYFNKLNALDAQPGLIELTALCIGRGIQVVACDLDPLKVIPALDQRNPDYAPHNEASLFQAWGMAERDRHTANMIGSYLRVGGISTGRLMIWGAAHFTPDVDRGAGSLGTLLRAEGLNVSIFNP